MIIDAHYHLEEEMQSIDALLEQMQRHSIDRLALMARINEPFHLEGLAKKAGELLPGMLMSRFRFLGLLLYNSTVTSDGRVSALGTKYLLYHEPDNEYVDKAIQTHPEKFYGWIFVNPKVSDPMKEVERWYGKHGWIGVKAHPFWHSYPIAMLDDVAAFCVEKSIPILIHLGSSREQGDYRFLPERHPKLKIIYPHAAVPRYREIWSYVKEKENIFIDLSNPVYVNEGILPTVVRALGAENCLHGTDGPYVNATQGRMLERILQLPLSDSEREQILGRNFLEMIEV
jgi:predicted TIM-barrel fold metal-dependent hydrolase